MALRDLPSVDRLARQLDGGLPWEVVVDVARSALDEARRVMRRGEEADPVAAAQDELERLRRARPVPVINATGVLLHTNLGRAPLHPEAARLTAEAATGYGNLELDLTTGERGGRSAYLERMLRVITGAEAAMAVNNNAGALFLVLTALASGRGVPVSRGELIEIGGSYRLPELMASTGAEMVEVGTTNRTRLSDYEAAFERDVALLLKVHPSNYRVTGFVEETGIEALSDLARRRGVPLVFDAGSGLVDARTPWLGGAPPSWLRGEPGVVQALEAGCDLVLFSGDKLFGGPQAGIVVGSADLVARLRRHPVARALRLDGPTLAALTVTAEIYARGEAAELPFWTMATLTAGELEARCRVVLHRSGVPGEVVAGASTPGAGSVPGSELPTPAIGVAGSADRIHLALLAGDPPVVGRREGGRLVLDLRAVPPHLDETVAEALAAAARA